MTGPDLDQFRIENIAPVLNVRDIKTSLAFYVGLLGFKNAEWGDENFTAITRDRSGIYLCRQGQGAAGNWIWIGFDGDILTLHEYLRSKGVKIKLPQTNFSWAQEMHVEDPDGHTLRLGTDPDSSLPFEQGW